MYKSSGGEWSWSLRESAGRGPEGSLLVGLKKWGEGDQEEGPDRVEEKAT